MGKLSKKYLQRRQGYCRKFVELVQKINPSLITDEDFWYEPFYYFSNTELTPWEAIEEWKKLEKSKKYLENK